VGPDHAYAQKGRAVSSFDVPEVREPGGEALVGPVRALAAIPVAGSLQVIWVDWLRQRRGEEPAGAT